MSIKFSDIVKRKSKMKKIDEGSVKMKLTEKQLEAYKTAMSMLEKEWEVNSDELMKLHSKNYGIRSSQIGALVMLLVRLGVIK